MTYFDPELSSPSNFFLVLMVQHDVKSPLLRGSVSSLEHALISLASHVDQEPCHCSNVDQRWSFSLQILSIPFLWHHLPFFKEVISCYKVSWRVL